MGVAGATHRLKGFMEKLNTRDKKKDKEKADAKAAGTEAARKDGKEKGKDGKVDGRGAALMEYWKRKREEKAAGKIAKVVAKPRKRMLEKTKDPSFKR